MSFASCLDRNFVLSQMDPVCNRPTIFRILFLQSSILVYSDLDHPIASSPRPDHHLQVSLRFPVQEPVSGSRRLLDRALQHGHRRVQLHLTRDLHLCPTWIETPQLLHLFRRRSFRQDVFALKVPRHHVRGVRH